MHTRVSLITVWSWRVSCMSRGSFRCQRNPRVTMYAPNMNELFIVILYWQWTTIWWLQVRASWLMPCFRKLTPNSMWKMNLYDFGWCREIKAKLQRLETQTVGQRLLQLSLPDDKWLEGKQNKRHIWKMLFQCRLSGTKNCLLAYFILCYLT